MLRIATGLFISAFTLVGTAEAVDYRWSQGFGQGTTEAIIRNKNGASLNIYCPAGSVDTTPGMFVDSEAVKSKKNATVYIQIVVDGANHPFELRETQYLAAGRGFRNNLDRLVSALRSTKSKNFTVEYPQHNVVETFSLSNARAALSSVKKSILDECE